MEPKEQYIEQDCSEEGPSCSMQGRVVVLRQKGLPPGNPDQLYFCLCGNGAGARPKGIALFLISLYTGDFSLHKRGEVIGVLKPELLPDSAKLRLSHIRPVNALSLSCHAPLYRGLCFFQDGRYAGGADLCGETEAMAYAELQMPYQHRVLICGKEGSFVLEIMAGKLVCPAPRVWNERMNMFREVTQID